MQKMDSLCQKNGAAVQRTATTKKIEEKTPKQLENPKIAIKKLKFKKSKF